MEYYVIRDTSDELQHHGILGMKWGIRRYQNPDGTLTKAGKRRQAKLDAKAFKKKADEAYYAWLKSEKEKRKAIKAGKLPEGYFFKKDASPEVKAADKKVEELASQLLDYKDLDTKRGIEAAKTGIMALNRANMRGYGKSDPDNEYVQEWFLYEDSTVGLGVIADMANQGWSKEKIMKTIADADEVYRKSGYYANHGKKNETGYTKSVYALEDLGNGYDAEYGAFAEACVEVVKERRQNSK